MQNLGHFEFGLNRRPINFGDTELTLEIKQLLDEESITGYIKYWNMIYTYIGEILNDNNLKQNLLLVDYDKFCSKPATVLKSIYAFCDLDVEESTIEKQAFHFTYRSFGYFYLGLTRLMRDWLPLLFAQIFFIFIFNRYGPVGISHSIVAKRKESPAAYCCSNFEDGSKDPEEGEYCNH